MDFVLQWGVDLIKIIQTIRMPALDHLMKAISASGNYTFYLMMIPLFYWCVDKRNAIRLFYLFLFSTWLNSVTKDMLDQPRPFDLDESIRVGRTGGPGLPSGHAQGALVFWGYLALWARKRWFSATCIAIIMLIAFSRLYLGVHFPTDLLGGWFLGLVLLLPFNYLANRFEARLPSIPVSWLITAGTLLPIAMAFIFPSRWSVSPMGITAGFTLAIILEKKHIGLGAAKNFLNGLGRFIIGIAGLFGTLLGFKALMVKEAWWHLPAVFTQYYLIGLWIGFCAPFVFKKLGLDDSHTGET